MRNRPKSRWENEDGSINLGLVGEVPEYPEVVKWEKEYAEECDRLAEREAVKTGKRHWGRWYLCNAGLVTRTSRPNVGHYGWSRGGIYDIALNRLDEDWVRHMKEKRWMGEQGIKDLTRALEALKVKV